MKSRPCSRGPRPPVQAAEQEGADLHVLQGVGIFPLIDLHVHLFLVLEHGVEHLGVRGRQLAVAPDQGHVLVHVRRAVQFPRGTGAEGVGRDVYQHRLHVVPRFDARLHAGAQRDAQLGIDLAVRLLAQALRQDRRDPRNAGGAAHQQHAIELARAYAGILQRRGHGLERAVEKRLEVALEIGAGQLAGEMPGLAGDRSDVVLLDAHAGLIPTARSWPVRPPAAAAPAAGGRRGRSRSPAPSRYAC